ncbi:MAG: hypothetical protein QOJ42_3425 [Acidobacteriaceae bacterium]|nr:hypothetical protein [Acidobacteriaceae bacterium]
MAGPPIKRCVLLLVSFLHLWECHGLGQGLMKKRCGEECILAVIKHNEEALVHSLRPKDAGCTAGLHTLQRCANERVLQSCGEITEVFVASTSEGLT